MSHGPIVAESVALSDKDGFVIMHFANPTEWVALEPETARQLAEAMARKAYKVRFGDDPTPTGKSQITDQLRGKLVTRVALMLNSLADSPVDNKVKAASIVDSIIKEVS